jgi:hypothetical protein
MLHQQRAATGPLRRQQQVHAIGHETGGVDRARELRGQGLKVSPSGGDRLVEIPNLALSDLILGDMRVRSVHKIGYGHDRDGATA